MREHPSYRETSVLAWLIGAVIAAFVAQMIAQSSTGGAMFVSQYLVLSPNIGRGYVWTLLTYGFVHYDLLHILLNVLGLYLLGRTLLPVLGGQRFVGFFFGAMLLGGLMSVAVDLFDGLNQRVMGVSAVVTGLLAVFATLYPEQRIGFLLIPVTFKAKHMAWALAGLSLVLMIFSELRARGGGVGFAHSAHLGGMLAGWLYGRFIHHRTDGFSLRPSVELPAWMRRRKRTAGKIKPSYTVNVTPPPQDLRAEVDRILDKINSEGFGSLTEEERRVLDDARDLLNKR